MKRILDTMKVDAIHDAVLVWGAVSSREAARLREERVTVIVPEQRPSMRGLEEVLPFLKHKGVRCLYCTDNMIGTLFVREKITRTLLFYTSRASGGVHAPSGSLYMYLLSTLHDVPVTFCAQGNSIDKGKRQSSPLKFTFEVGDFKYIIKDSQEFIPVENLPWKRR